MYASSTAVAVMEVVKFLTCMIVIAYHKRSAKEMAKSLYEVRQWCTTLQRMTLTFPYRTRIYDSKLCDMI